MAEHGADERAVLRPFLWQRGWRAGERVEMRKTEQVFRRDGDALQGAEVPAFAKCRVCVCGLLARAILVPHAIGVERGIEL